MYNEGVEILKCLFRQNGEKLSDDELSDKWGECSPETKAMIILSSVSARDVDKLLHAISYFEKPEEAVAFAEENIKRYTTSNFGKAWLYEEVKRLATSCSQCPLFFGRYHECQDQLKENCQLHLERAFYNHKTIAQEVAEELNIPYFRV